MARIEDHAAIGDSRSVALVTSAGSIDWLCWPRFDSGSIFAALLDPNAGRFAISPTMPFRTHRRYVPGTNVLEILHRTASGTVRLVDFMPVAAEDDRVRRLAPEHEIRRVVRCDEGEVEIEVLYEPRPDYGRETPRLRDAGPLGIRAETRRGLLTLTSQIPLQVEEGSRARGRVRLRAGEERQLSLTFADEWPAVLPPLGDTGLEALDRTVRWWREWSGRIRYEGPRRDEVIRSALALRLLVYAPSGAVVAAATTSLPERIGGALNWDYRYCWLRDAALTVRALLGLGFREEAEAFVSWALHATRLTWPRLRILYDVHGNLPAAERELERLEGWRGSRPVRVGNLAAEQLQLDVYGEVIDSVALFVRSGGTLDGETQRMLRALGEYVCRNWQQPDEGIWEPRSGRRHHTHSRVMCWAALDRLLELSEAGQLCGIPVELFERNRRKLREEVERRGWNAELRSYVSELDGEDVDASLLLMGWYGFEAPGSERMRSTVRRIRERLGASNGHLYRYRGDGAPEEGAFGICGFWEADVLARGAGTVEEAEEAFERLCDTANDVGLFAEEIDPESGQALGNFPQAFTHLGLINAALSLEERLKKERSIQSRVAPRRSEVDEAVVL